MAETKERCAETEKSVSTQVWNTNTVARAEAFDFYREGVCAAFMPLRPELDRKNRESFHAIVKSSQLGDGVLNIVSAQAHTVLKGKTEIIASSEDCFYLNLQIAGQCAISQKEKTITLLNGDVGIFDSTSAFELHHDNCTALGVASLMLPKHLFSETEINGPQILSHHPVFGNILTESIRSLSHATNNVSGREVAQLHKLVLKLAILASTPSNKHADSSTRSTAQYLRIKHIIRQNCTKPGFGIKQCSAMINLSVGYIHHIFADNGARFGTCLQKQRLLLAKQYLSNPEAGHLPVSSIAYEVGFKDVSHFGRVFRNEFGQSPGAWRSRRTSQIT